jgi:hypothetical protein
MRSILPMFPATKTDKPTDTFSPCWKREALGAGRVPTVKKYLYGRAGAISIKEETPYNLLAIYAPGIAQGRRAATKEKRQAAGAMLARPIPPGLKPAVDIKSLLDMQLIFHDCILMCAARDGKTNR